MNPSQAIRRCIIFNPTARGDKARRFRRHLDAFRSSADLLLSDSAGAARQLAAQAVQNGCDVIIAAGGDGTINEVVNGIGDVPGGFERATLGLLPIGTVNVFAREIQIPQHLDDSWKVILQGHQTQIDLPQIHFNSLDGTPGHSRHFIQMAGSGWDARAVQLVSWQLKKRIGQFAYMIAGLQALRQARPKIQVVAGSRNCEGELVILGNGRYYGGIFTLFHEADLRDGLLDVCVFPTVNWMIMTRYFWAFVTRRPAKLTQEIYFQSESISLGACSQCPLQVDGEHAGHLPVTCTVRRQILRLITPPTPWPSSSSAASTAAH